MNAELRPFLNRTKRLQILYDVTKTNRTCEGHEANIKLWNSVKGICGGKSGADNTELIQVVTFVVH